MVLEAIKNVERDAADLADLLRMGRLPEAWVAPRAMCELREVTRCRRKLVRTRTDGPDRLIGGAVKLER